MIKQQLQQGQHVIDIDCIVNIYVRLFDCSS